MRYFTALNIKDTSAYSNINARLLYLHMCCSMDYTTRLYTCSTRMLASDLNMTHKAVRCALDALLTASLIRAQVGTQPRAQATTYIISDLTYSKGTSEGTSEGTFINKELDKFTLTHARARFLEEIYVEKAATYWGVEIPESHNWVSAFLDVQAARQRDGWQNEGDAWRHMLDWCDKKRTRRRTASRTTIAPPPPPEEQEQQEEHGPCPPGWAWKDWENITRIVKQGLAAPGVIDIYNEALKTL